MLKDKSHAPRADALAGHVSVVEEDLAAVGVGRFQAGNDPQEGRLPGAGRSQQGDQFPVRNFQTHVVQGDKVPEDFADVPDLDAHARLRDR